MKNLFGWALVGILLFGGPAAAAPIVVVGASVGVDELVCGSDTTGDVPSQCTGFNSGSNAYARAEVEGPITNGNGSANVYVHLDGIGLALDAANSSSLPSRTTASAFGSISDALLMNAPDLPIAGRVLWRFKLTGDVLVGPSGQRQYCVDLATPTVSDEYCASNEGVSQTNNGFSFEFNGGALIAELRVSFDDLTTAAEVASGQLSLSLSGSIGAKDGESLALKLDHTLVVEEISLRDLNDNLIFVPGLSLTSDSGFAYPFLNALTQGPGDTVPEPSTLVILGAGLLALGATRRRRLRAA